LGLHNKPWAAVHPGLQRTGPKAEEEEEEEEEEERPQDRIPTHPSRYLQNRGCAPSAF